MRPLRRWLLPGGAVLLAGIVAATALSEDLLWTLTGQYRWMVYGIAAALAGGFHRSRVFHAIVGLAALDYVTLGFSEMDAVGALGSLYMVFVGALAVSRDRGLASRSGLAQLGAVLLLGATPVFAFRDPSRLEAFLSLSPLPAWTTSWTPYTQSVALFSAIGLGATAWGIHRWRGPVERALLWSQLTVLVAMHPRVASPSDSLFLITAAVVLAVTLLETTYAMAYRDDLTGLPARRALMRDLEEMKGLYTAVMLDVDHFKKFNDKYGHDTGDQVLKLVASHLGRARGGAKAYRYGGEEFTLLFPGKVTDEAWGHVEDVRASIEGARFLLRSWNRPREKPDAPAEPKKPKPLSVTISAGLADTGPDGMEAEAVLKKADQALYRAKKDGRNRVSI